MGCIASTPAGEANNKPVTSSVGGTHYPNWTLPPPFKIEPPPTLSELHKKREEFWDTQPSYGGSREIWDVLKAAVTSAQSSGDIQTARLFVESAGIIVATPHLTVVFDERGAKYDIPRWVLATPTNVAPEPETNGDVA
jgi:hypothetical protein